MTAENLTAALKHEALRLGFDLVGACPAVEPPDIGRFREWLALGRAGQMYYLANRVAAYEHPQHVLDGARSILMLAVGYKTVDPVTPGLGQARVSRYAWGADYHDVIRRRLRKLADLHHRLAPDAHVRGVVDTAPLLEREFAQLAGLGWIGKNTMLVNDRLGSWTFLAALVTSEVLDYDEPYRADHCGTCRACLDACPTGALVDAHQLDARRCISYLTIESRDPIPPVIASAIGDRFFGCDACQEACPWNRRAPRTSETAFHPAPGMNPVDLAELLAMDDEIFRKRFRNSPLQRPRREGLVRNAEVVLKSQSDSSRDG